MEQEITVLTTEELMRKRPGMFIGRTDEQGIFDLLEGVLVDLTELHQKDDLFITTALHTDLITLNIEGPVNTEAMQNILTADCKGYIFIKALMALSQRFEASLNSAILIFEKGKLVQSQKNFESNNPAPISFCFNPDSSIFKEQCLDFHRLCEKQKQFTMLNRRLRLLVKDHRSVMLSQNYFHYPDGIKKLFNDRIYQKHSGSLFQLFIDASTPNYAYQLGISFNPALWKTETLSFANEINTYEGGSLVDGVVAGVISALKKYVSRYPRRTYRFSRKKIERVLTMVLTVRGKDMQWAGCTKAKLYMPFVKRESQRLSSTELSKYLRKNPEHAEKLIAMFDETTYLQTDRLLTHCTMACLVSQKRVMV